MKNKLKNKKSTIVMLQYVTVIQEWNKQLYFLFRPAQIDSCPFPQPEVTRLVKPTVSDHLFFFFFLSLLWFHSAKNISNPERSDDWQEERRCSKKKDNKHLKLWHVQNIQSTRIQVVMVAMVMLLKQFLDELLQQTAVP